MQCNPVGTPLSSVFYLLSAVAAAIATTLQKQTRAPVAAALRTALALRDGDALQGQCAAVLLAMEPSSGALLPFQPCALCVAGPGKALVRAGLCHADRALDLSADSCRALARRTNTRVAVSRHLATLLVLLSGSPLLASGYAVYVGWLPSHADHHPLALRPTAKGCLPTCCTTSQEEGATRSRRDAPVPRRQ